MLLVTVLLTGCSSGGNAPPPSADPPVPQSSTPRVPQSSTPRAPKTPETTPEPSPVIEYVGKTKVLTLGDTEIRATRNEIGISVACNIKNTTDRTHDIKVTVSVGNGSDWVTTNNFEFQKVAAGQTASETTVMGASFEGELPDDPKIYVDSVIFS
ncbi:hypothetical protein ABT007_23520 [Streptomyces griseus]|uniref:hypothetical protein n=1 Tax=Streptomyces griseus TaxID=1911 RepID=UPI00333053C4